MTDVGGIQVFGGTYPARIWQAFMSAELAGQPALPLPPAGPVCDRPGASITDGGRGRAERRRRGAEHDGALIRGDASRARRAAAPRSR